MENFEKKFEPSKENVQKKEINNNEDSGEILYESEEEVRSVEEIVEELRLPPEEWSKGLKDYLEKRGEEIKKDKEREKAGISPEEERKNIFERYVKHFDFSSEKLNEKRILDLGCGTYAEFIEEAKKRGLKSDLRGIDQKIDFKNISPEIAEKLTEGNFEEKLPEGPYDYIIAYGSVFAFTGENPKRTIENALSELNEGGEIKIYPIQEPIREDIEGFEILWKRFNEILSSMKQDEGIDYNFEPKEVWVAEEGNGDILVWNLLTITRNQK